MKICYIAHPIGGDVEYNLADLRRIIKHINLTMPEVLPFCPYYADVVSMDDNVPEERSRGLNNDFHLLQSGFINEVWLTGGRISNGMQQEINVANVEDIKVVDYINHF